MAFLNNTGLQYLIGLIKASLNTKENSSNKVTSWSSSTTDTHYPSEKLVKDSLDGKANTFTVVNNEPTLAWNSTSTIGTVAGTSLKVKMPTNPDTTYTIATGTANGKIKVTPSTGDAYEVSVYGLKSAAYTESSAYATSNHGHNNATTSAAGFMSAADKATFNAIPTTYATITYVDEKVTGVYRYKGSVDNYSDLPTEIAQPSDEYQVGDVYNVVNASSEYPAGTNFAVKTRTQHPSLAKWVLTWDALGGSFTLPDNLVTYTKPSTASAFAKFSNTSGNIESWGTMPASGDTNKFLKGDGTWAIPGNTTYSAGTGLSLSGTTFNHSNSVTAITTAGLYKVKYDAQGHITGTTAVAKSDITALGIPESDTNTTYTFVGGTNGFTVTPSGGTAQTVTVTPSITNNITGTGSRTSGTIVAFSGTNTITNATNAQVTAMITAITNSEIDTWWTT